jgi:ABC-2 type transport system permease protein
MLSAVRTLAQKDLRVLLRDRRSAVILLAMPLIFVLVLGVALGEGFGEKPDDRLRVSLVKLDLGPTPVLAREAAALWFAGTGCGFDAALGGFALFAANRAVEPPLEPWVEAIVRDLSETAGIRLEIIADLPTAHELIRNGKRAAIVVFRPEFSEQISRCSFLASGINPFYRDGVNLNEIGVTLLRDETQLAAAGIIDQVIQVTLLRVILPWMIGRAFEKLSEPIFMSMLTDEVPGGKMLPPNIKSALGAGVQGALRRFFPKYNLTGKTWAALTKSEPKAGSSAGVTTYRDDGGGFLGRGAVRYQILVPSYTVMFAFFLVLSVGWLFVSERRQGTLKRLRAAPLSRAEILMGKLLPCFALSLGQGFFLLLMGRLVFGMKWGPEPLWLIPVVVSTSCAAMGLAMLVASVARTETQVAIYGTLLVLVLAGISGCLMPRELMTEAMKQISRLTPHAWALDAYSQLLLSSTPNLSIVMTSCGVLCGFGVGFLWLAWWLLRLD